MRIAITDELEKLIADYEWYNSEYCAREIADYICEAVKEANENCN